MLFIAVPHLKKEIKRKEKQNVLLVGQFLGRSDQTTNRVLA